MKLTEQSRYLTGDGFWYWRYTDISIAYAITDTWSISPAYRLVATRKPGKEWTDKNLWHIDANNKLKAGVVELQSRFQFAYIELPGDDQVDVRPEWTLCPVSGLTAWKLRPYAAYEFWYNITDNILFLNRITAGVSIKPFKKVEVKTFLAQETTRTESTDWNERYNMGFNASFSF